MKIRLFVCAILIGALMATPVRAQTTQSAASTKAEDSSEVISRAQSAVQKDTSSAASWYELGGAADKAGNHQLAIDAFEHARELKYRLPYTLYNLACVYTKSGQMDKAITSLDQLADISPWVALAAVKDPDVAALLAVPEFKPTLKKIEDATAPCEHDSVSRQFDFWIGSWDVFNRTGGALVGTSLIEKSLDGCVLIENWQGSLGETGKSFNSVNPATGKWQQYWVASYGAINQYEGDVRDGSMHYIGVANGRGTAPQQVRLTFTPFPDGSVRQFSETKKGADWVPNYEFIYRRKVTNEK